MIDHLTYFATEDIKKIKLRHRKSEEYGEFLTRIIQVIEQDVT